MTKTKKSTTSKSTMSETEKKLKRKVNDIYAAKPNGREKGFMESIYWGIAKPYININDVKKAGIKPNAKRISKNPLWYYATKNEAYKTLLHLLK